MSNLRQRIRTAVLLIPLVVAGIVYLPWAWLTLALVLFVLAGAYEWTALAGWTARRWLQAVFALSLLVSAFVALVHPTAMRAVMVMAVIGWALALAAVIAIEKGRPLPQSLPLWSWWGAGWLLLVPALTSIVVIHRSVAHGPLLVLLLMVMVWAADIGAYFAGRAFGKCQLAAKVSPGKSWEGVAGGALAAGVAALLFALYFNHPLAAFMMLGTLVIAASVLGDLTESLAKRVSGKKDSGGLLPGHGGILDRIDSLTAAAPVFLVGLELMGVVSL